MNTKLNSSQIVNDADETLTAFVTAGAQNVAGWTVEHPTLARDFARLATEHWSGVDDSTFADAVAENRLRQVGLNTLKAMRAKMAPVKAPLTSLMDAARLCGLDSESLAARLALPETYVVKLHRRLFAPESLPQSLVKNLADSLNRATEDIQMYLSASPRLAAGASFKSDTAPTIGEREDFRITITNDGEVIESSRLHYLTEESGA